MKTEITRDQLAELFRSVQRVFEENEALLLSMDAKMGDGDLGLTMKKGFSALPEVIEGLEEADIGKALMKAGMKMTSIVPSTMGTLMGSGIMSGGKAIVGCGALGAGELAAFLAGFEAGIAKRGKCQRGQRTVLDCIGPAADTAKAAVNSGADLADVARAAYEGAVRGVEATASMTPVFGKAAVHKAAAQGMVDQGAYAGQCFVEGLKNYIA